jgi:hypothetical protein
MVKGAKSVDKLKDSSNLLGEAKLKPLAGVAATGVAATGAYGAYNKFKDDLSESYNQTMDNISNRVRPEHNAQGSADRQESIKDKFEKKRKGRGALELGATGINNAYGVLEMGGMMGSGYVADILSGYAGIITGLTNEAGHEVSDSLNRAGFPNAAETIKPSMRTDDYVNQVMDDTQNALTFMPRSDKSQEYAQELSSNADDIANYWTTGLGAQGKDPLVNQLQSASEYVGTGDYTEGMKPIDNFVESTDELAEAGYPGTASVLYGLPDVF